MKIGYVRVSTQEQNTIRQEALMKDLGVDEVYIDHLSGKSTDRPALKKLMSYVRKGDTVIVESISRFARNTRDLFELVEQLTAKGVEFISKKEAIDTTTPAGNSCSPSLALLPSWSGNTFCSAKRKELLSLRPRGSIRAGSLSRGPTLNRWYLYGGRAGLRLWRL